MPAAAKNLLYILLIPLVMAIGHDLYLNYFSTPEKIRQVERLRIDPYEFAISDIGWIWQEYIPSTMDLARQSMPLETWKSYIDPILQQPTILVTCVPFLLGLVFLMITFIMGVGPFTEYARLKKQKKYGATIYKNSEIQKTKFNRK